ncbi:sensor histidine kinase [Paenibacillus hamazuiensis]|uniref:sensor histidine kinase n=1 Tax=Paenibacillus hamazuiensis TaxID=2936508 RepID=UPI00200E7CBC|nr:sensor histidine kinase [Paenibacillus hamazuiensis]
MIRKYIAERRSWLLFFAFLQLLLLFIGYVDAALPFESMLYIVFLSTLVFLGFAVARYHRETRFYKLLENEEPPGSESEVAARSPFERVVAACLEGQAQRLGLAASHSETLLEQEKDELLSWIHEVKTPLTAMRLMIDRLENEPLKGPLTYEWLRIHLLLDRQLHQRRLPFLENDLYMEQVDLAQLLHMELKTLQIWCIQKGIGFDVELEVKEVLSDAKWLAFILRQLLTNAVKYSDASSDIAVSSCVQDGHMKLEIKDCGRGIDPKDLPRIFDKGFTSTNHHADGAATGMGLYLARKAADKLHIRISVRSEPGAGAAFTLTFPKRNDFVQMTGM